MHRKWQQGDPAGELNLETELWNVPAWHMFKRTKLDRHKGVRNFHTPCNAQFALGIKPFEKMISQPRVFQVTIHGQNVVIVDTPIRVPFEVWDVFFTIPSSGDDLSTVS